MIALNPIVEVFAINVGDVIEMGVIPVVNFADHLTVSGGFVGAD